MKRRLAAHQHARLNYTASIAKTALEKTAGLFANCFGQRYKRVMSQRWRVDASEKVAVFYRTFCFVAMLFAYAGCSSVDRASTEYVVYGTYAGECMGHCARMFKLEGSRLLVDTTDSYFESNGESVAFRGDTMPRENFLTALAVREQLPELLVQSSSQDFGQPDHGDLGGIFIEIKRGGTVRRFHIDTDLDKIPNELRSYAELIMRTTGFKRL